MEEAADDDGGGTAGKGLAVDLGNAASLTGEAMEGEEGLFLLKPELIAGAAPVIEILALDGLAIEFSIEDFSNGRKAVEPGKNVGGRLVVEQAAIEFVADVVGKAGDFAGEMAIGGLRVGKTWLVIIHGRK